MPRGGARFAAVISGFNSYQGATVMAKTSKPAAKISATAGKASKQLGQKVTRTAKPTRKEIRQEVPRRAQTGKH
jgi:hypothetical protein